MSHALSHNFKLTTTTNSKKVTTAHCDDDSILSSAYLHLQFIHRVQQQRLPVSVQVYKLLAEVLSITQSKFLFGAVDAITLGKIETFQHFRRNITAKITQQFSKC